MTRAVISILMLAFLNVTASTEEQRTTTLQIRNANGHRINDIFDGLNPNPDFVGAARRRVVSAAKARFQNASCGSPISFLHDSGMPDQRFFAAM
jgi:hypothetical protein